MPKQTQQYRMPYFASGEITNADSEQKRWNTLDGLLRGLYGVIGNGVISGWVINVDPATPLGIIVTPGSGVISSVAVESTTSNTVSLVANSRNYIHATLTPSSYYAQTVTFFSTLSPSSLDNSLVLGSAVTDGTSVVSTDATGRRDIGILGSIKAAIQAHRHNGADGNPPPVDLASEVQGTLSLSSLPDLDGSILKTGTIDSARLPKIDHRTGLTDNGTLTHAQLDSFVEHLSSPNARLMGDTFVTNLLQLILALKGTSPQIDQYLVNELALIPGISPDSYFDMVNTTASVDLGSAGSHLITGSHGSAGYAVMTKAWDSQSEFSEAVLVDTVAAGSVINLAQTETKVYVEDFEGVGDWQATATDLSTANAIDFTTDASTKVGGGFSGFLKVNIDSQSNYTLLLEKTFAAQDWSAYDRAVFYLNTSSVDHGDIYFYFNDSVAGEQFSSTMVLERGAPTINRDTGLNGWREISIDISGMTRNSVNKVGLSTSSKDGWDSSKPLELHIDEMYLTSGNRFLETGTATFRFGKEIGQQFNQIRYDAVIPAGTSMAIYYRLANDTAEFDNETSPLPWTDNTVYPETGIPISPADVYNYVEIQVVFNTTSGVSYKLSPELHRLFLDYQIINSAQSFVYDTQDVWKSGALVNIDADTNPGSMGIAGIADVGGIIYGTVGSIMRADDNLNPLWSVLATSLPKSLAQIVNGTPSGLGQVSSLDYGADGSVWLADTDNDRVVCLGNDGVMMQGFYGHCTEAPGDPYGVEDRGPGSNTGGSAVTPTTLTTAPKLLQAIYNPVLAQLSLTFDQDLDYTHTADTSLNVNNVFLAMQAHRFYFSGSAGFGLLGVVPQSYEIWKATTNDFISQFTLRSNVLQVQLSQVDAAVLASIVDFKVPSLCLVNPVANQLVPSESISIQFGVTNATLGVDGYALQYQTDGGSPQTTNSTTIALSGLIDGVHTLTASLTKDGLVLGNAEAQVNSSFIVDTSVVVDGWVQVDSPVPNQRFSSNEATVAFSSNWAEDFQYVLDGGAPQLISDNPFVLSELTVGEHTLSIECVHSWGDPADTPDRTIATVSFFIGASSNAGLKAYADEGLINGLDSGLPNTAAAISVDVAPIVMTNLYAPIEVQYLPNDTGALNPEGLETVVIGKLRSPSTSIGLNSTPPAEAVTVTSATTADIKKKIYATGFLDGHSVVQFDMEGNVLLSNNAAVFATDKESAKIQLGSVQKTSHNELTIGDAENHRAIITLTDITTHASFISWNYASDRCVSDFRLVPTPNAVISVTNTDVTPKTLYIKTGTLVTWTNNSTAAITIYSGKTSMTMFNEDPDLALYGDDFVLQTLAPGESAAMRFENLGEFYWFVYPTIQTLEMTGLISVSTARIAATDKYLVVENDTAEALGGRIAQLDAWGNMEWTFGEGYLYRPRDARILTDGSIIIST